MLLKNWFTIDSVDRVTTVMTISNKENNEQSFAGYKTETDAGTNYLIFVNKINKIIPIKGEISCFSLALLQKKK